MQDTYYFSLKITKNKPLGLLQISKDRLKTKATMRPSSAYSLMRMLDVKEGDLIIDPMSGSSMFCEIGLKVDFFSLSPYCERKLAEYYKI